MITLSGSHCESILNNTLQNDISFTTSKYQSTWSLNRQLLVHVFFGRQRNDEERDDGLRVGLQALLDGACLSKRYHAVVILH